MAKYAETYLALEEITLVFEIFEVIDSFNIESLNGVVAVVKNQAGSCPRCLKGKVVQIHADGKLPIGATIDIVKNHNTVLSFFFGGLSKLDVPVGSSILL